MRRDQHDGKADFLERRRLSGVRLRDPRENRGHSPQRSFRTEENADKPHSHATGLCPAAQGLDRVDLTFDGRPCKQDDAAVQIDRARQPSLEPVATRAVCEFRESTMTTSTAAPFASVGSLSAPAMLAAARVDAARKAIVGSQ